MTILALKISSRGRAVRLAVALGVVAMHSSNGTFILVHKKLADRFVGAGYRKVQKGGNR